MTRYGFTVTVMGLAILLSVVLVAPASSFTTIMPGDITGNLIIDNQDFTLFDTTSNTDSATGPYYPVMCAANSGSNCNLEDRTWMEFMVQNNFQHLSSAPYLDFSSLSCEAPCTPAPTESVTISGNVQSSSVVNSIPAEGPGVSCSNTWAAIFGGPMTATVSVINDTTGGASVTGPFGFTDVDTALAICEMSFQATCGPNGGDFTVRVEFPYESFAENPPASGTPTISGTDSFEVGPISCGSPASLVELTDSAGTGTGTETIELSIDTSLANGATLGGYDITITFDNDCSDDPDCADFDSVILGDAPFDVPELNMAGPIQGANTDTATIRIADVHTKDNATFPANTKTRVKTIQFVNVQGTQTVTANITSEDSNNLIDWDGTPIPFGAPGSYQKDGTLQF